MKQTKKAKYRVRNWSEYNAALVKRGSLDIWIDEAMAKDWESARSKTRRSTTRSAPSPSRLSATTSARAPTGSPPTPRVRPAARVGHLHRRTAFEAHRLVATASRPSRCRSSAPCVAGPPVSAATRARRRLHRSRARRRRFWEPFGRRGFTPDSGGTWLIPRLVGLARARQMILLGREVSGDEADRGGSSTRPSTTTSSKRPAEALLARAGRRPDHRLRAREVLPAPLARAPTRPSDGTRGARLRAVVAQRRLQRRPPRVPVRTDPNFEGR